MSSSPPGQDPSLQSKTTLFSSSSRHHHQHCQHPLKLTIWLPMITHHRHAHAEVQQRHIVVYVLGDLCLRLQLRKLREYVFQAVQSLIIQRNCADEQKAAPSSGPKLSSEAPAADAASSPSSSLKSHELPPPPPSASVKEGRIGPLIIMTLDKEEVCTQAGGKRIEICPRVIAYDESLLASPAAKGEVYGQDFLNELSKMAVERVPDYGMARYKSSSSSLVSSSSSASASTERRPFDPDDDRAVFLDDEAMIMNLLPTMEDEEEEGEEIDENGHCLDLYIIPAHLIPPPPFIVSIVSTRQNVDAFGRLYTAYDIFIKHGPLEWVLDKRYSDFDALHEKLLAGSGKGKGSMNGNISKEQLPKLPSKKLLHSEDLIHERAQKLNQYLKDLILLPEAMQNIHVLSFLGVMSTSRAELPKALPNDTEGNKPRQVIHLSALRSHLEAGDIVLFKCAHSVAGIQRTVTGAEWDHVGLVIQDVAGRTLELLESTGDGVTCYPLLSRILAYSTEFTSYMAIRKLQGERTKVMMERLTQFVSRVNGKPYGFALRKLFPRKHRRASTDLDNNKGGGGDIGGGEAGSKSTTCEEDTKKSLTSTASPPPLLSASITTATGGGATEVLLVNIKKEDSFFCSELVAAGLQEMGVIRPDYNCSYFWPGSFAKKGEIDEALVEGLAYGDVVMLDTRILEVGRAIINGHMRR